MGAVCEQRSELGSLLREIDAIEQRPRWIPAAVWDDELEVLNQRLYRRPRDGAVADAPVDEHDAHRSDLT